MAMIKLVMKTMKIGTVNMQLDVEPKNVLTLH